MKNYERMAIGTIVDKSQDNGGAPQARLAPTPYFKRKATESLKPRGLGTIATKKKILEAA